MTILSVLPLSAFLIIASCASEPDTVLTAKDAANISGHESVVNKDLQKTNLYQSKERISLQGLKQDGSKQVEKNSLEEVGANGRSKEIIGLQGGDIAASLVSTK